MRYRGIKGKIWERVKQYTRLKYKDCYTCSTKNLESQNANSGHYRPVAIVGSNNKKSWDERFIRLQCGRCNGAGQGEQAIFRAKLVQEYGEKVVAKFDKEVAAKKVDKVENWEELLLYWENLLITELPHN